MCQYKNYVCIMCQNYAYLVACMDSLYLQELAQLNFRHMQREMAISLSISLQDLRNWVRPLQLLFCHTKQWQI